MKPIFIMIFNYLKRIYWHWTGIWWWWSIPFHCQFSANFKRKNILSIGYF